MTSDPARLWRCVLRGPGDTTAVAAGFSARVGVVRAFRWIASVHG